MMQEKFNSNVEKIAVSDIRQFDTEVSQIPDIIKLTLGEPDFNTPEHIKKAAIKAIKENKSHYTPNAGIMELREATAKYFNKKYDLNFKGSQVVTTVGATEAINASLQAILNPGDTIIVPTPIFPIYLPISELNQGNYKLIDTSEDGFVLTPERLENFIINNPELKLKCLVLNFPSNPTGVTYSKEQLNGIAKIAKKYDMWILSDEIYAELTYNGLHTSMASILPNRTILISGLSKSHAMTGWRIGYILGPQSFIDQVVKSHQYMVTAPTSIAQYAALEAMENGFDDATAMKEEYQKRRDYMAQQLEEAGFKVASPDGAFYLFAKIPENCSQDSWDFVRDLANVAKVAVIPGISFGLGGQGYIRISYAASMDTLKEAAKRIKEYTKNK